MFVVQPFDGGDPNNNILPQDSTVIFEILQYSFLFNRYGKVYLRDVTSCLIMLSESPQQQWPAFVFASEKKTNEAEFSDQNSHALKRCVCTSCTGTSTNSLNVLNI